MEQEAGLISGVVVDQSGNPVADARVYFTAGPAPFQDTAALTNDGGEFALAAPADGLYRVEASARGYAGAASAEVTASRGREVRLELRLRA
jgi:uncharacterized GH25 family protein